MRDAAGEIRRAVDGIDDPDVALEGSAAFLAEEGILREQPAQPGPNQLLHLGIGGGEKILRPLEIRALRARPLQEALAGEHAALPRDGAGCGKSQVEAIGRHRSGSSF